MKQIHLSFLLVFSLVSCQSVGVQKNMSQDSQDSYIWLEEVESAKALQFAREENEKTLAHFKKDPLFKTLESESRKIIMAKDRVPSVQLYNGELYNFWQDENHVRGLWRKTSLESYKSGKPVWTLLLDLDALAKKENENWVWKGSSLLPVTYDRTLLYLSRGGKDASVVREFDMKTKTFVADGFALAEAKSSMSWKDRDTVYVGTDFGPDSMTSSGYPRIVKMWKRGTPLSAAVEVNSVLPTDMSAYTYVMNRPEGKYVVHSRRIGFYESENWIENAEGKKIKTPMPVDAEFHDIHKGQVLFLLRSDLKSFKKGSLVSLPLDKMPEGEKALQSLQVVVAPTDKRFIEGAWTGKNYLYVSLLDNVLSKVLKMSFENGQWLQQEIVIKPNGMTSMSSTDNATDMYLLQYVDFLQPYSTYLGNGEDSKNSLTLLAKSPDRFDGKEMQVERFEAISADGTAIPYFVVGKKGLKKNGLNPTLLYGYGGFEVSMQPSYLGLTGKQWLERGGVYVLSNLRGGGEFGPAWHQAVLKENRYKVYEDNIAIAEDLIKKGITSPKHLGIKGRSNGGLLVGATFVLRPDLFNAVLCQVPLLDMIRYHTLLAGASWMDEYGNPDDPKMREAILKYSPYQRVKAQERYPEVFFMTSTKDDRVHPGHARKMVAKMKDLGHSVFYYENIEGGHGGTANLEQSILWNSLEMTYLWEKLGPAPK